MAELFMAFLSLQSDAGIIPSLCETQWTAQHVVYNICHILLLLIFREINLIFLNGDFNLTSMT
jgi:hypothetical protein